MRSGAGRQVSGRQSAHTHSEADTPRPSARSALTRGVTFPRKSLKKQNDKIQTPSRPARQAPRSLHGAAGGARSPPPSAGQQPPVGRPPADRPPPPAAPLPCAAGPQRAQPAAAARGRPGWGTGRSRAAVPPLPEARGRSPRHCACAAPRSACGGREAPGWERWVLMVLEWQRAPRGMPSAVLGAVPHRTVRVVASVSITQRGERGFNTSEAAVSSP